MRIFFLPLLLLATAASADYSNHPSAGVLLDRLESEYSFSREELDGVRTALADAARVPKLIENEQQAKEKTLTWPAYQAIFINADRIRRGLEFLQTYKEPLAQAESEFGVPPEVVAAILGVETRFGVNATAHRTLDALATQGFEHPTRSPFFFSELTEFFVLCRELAFQPAAVKGSYAGAIGAAQFMPSNYRRYAVDFDGDGRRDLWALPDAIGSVANYLVHYGGEAGYRRDLPLMLPARLAARPPDFPVNRKRTTHPYSALTGLGIRAQDDLPPDEPVGLIELSLDAAPDGRKEYWIGLHNFFAIMTYNPQTLYAMAVAQLAQALHTAANIRAQ